MIAADTSACANHFLQGDSVLARLLTEEEIAVHPFIVGEIAAGNLKHRSEVLLDLSFLTASVWQATQYCSMSAFCWVAGITPLAAAAERAETRIHPSATTGAPARLLR